MWKLFWCLGTVTLLSLRTDGKPCPQPLYPISHSKMTCENVASEHQYEANVTVEVDVIKEVCKNVTVPVEDTSGGDTSGKDTNGESSKTSKRDTEANSETKTDENTNKDADKDTDKVTTTDKDTDKVTTTTKLVCTNETVKEDQIVLKNLTNTTYNTTCNLQCDTGYAFGEISSGDKLSQWCNNVTGLWSEQTADNYFAKWWDICTKKDMPQNRTTTTQVYLESTDPANKITDSWKCPSVANINKAMAVLYEEKTNLLLCISKKTCEQVVDLTECELVEPDGMGVEETSFRITLVHKLIADLSDTVTMKTFSKAISYVIAEGAFTLSIELAEKRKKRSTGAISYRANKENYLSEVEFVCPSGSGKIGDFCSECPEGYFQNSQTLRCDRCPIGSFADKEGESTCVECPKPLTTFQDRSTASSDCISKCAVKKTNNGTEEPAQGWSVTSSTIIQVECKPEHSLAYGSDTWYKCSEEAPHCYATCTLDKVPDNVMLIPNDTTTTQLVHENKTTVVCVDFIHYHTLTCNNGVLNWPTCDNVSVSYIGNRIYILFIAVLALGVVTFIMFFITLYLTRRRGEFKGGNFASVQTNIENPLEKPIVSLPVHVDEFSKRADIFNNGGIARWKAEFNLIPMHDSLQQKSIALATYNRKKNKAGARGIVPYDISRVKIGKVDDPLDDYYNASYINGWKGPRVYIVAQTPLPHTKDHFWKMVVEQQSRILINVHPSGDIDSPTEYHRYWPEHDGLYDNILVKNISSTDYDGFIVRQFKVGPVEWPETPASSPSLSEIGEEEVEEEVEKEEEEVEEEEEAEEEEAAEEEEEAVEEEVVETPEPSVTNLTEALGTNTTEEAETEAAAETSATNLTATEAATEAETEENGDADEDDDTKSEAYSEKTTKSIKTALSQRSAKTSASSGKYRIDLPYQHSFIVKQIHFDKWDENGEPDMQAFLKMILFHRDIIKFNLTKGPIIMHSEYGSDWASLFCATDYILDRLISETDLNIAGLTNALRQQRPMMIATVQQYIYLHHLMVFILEREDYEDLKYVGFKSNPLDLKECSVSSESSGSGPMKSIRAVSRAVQEGTKSVAKSVATVTQSLFGKISGNSDSDSD